MTCMGYYLYKRSAKGNEVHLIYDKKICLAGCNQGIVPKKLMSSNAKMKTPFAWTWALAQEYNNRNESVLIDIKPKKDELFYCELDSVFGVCYDDWTPVMYRLRRLYAYEKRGRDENHFVFDGIGHETIYTTSYMLGTLKDGQLAGKWTGPNLSSSNGALLWPETVAHFFRSIRERDGLSFETSMNEIKL